jgi:hypothetical protein
MVLSRQCRVNDLFLSPCPLSFVLHVSDLSANLLSIARITLELNCRVTFYSYCFFQDIVTGQTIGDGSLRDSLHYLDSQPNTQGQLTQAYHSVRVDDSTGRIWFWHPL